jgi:1,4-dihydroxy-2-naphthoyl-CoA synthase
VRIIPVSVVLFAAALCAACGGGHKLKMPCDLPPSALSYALDDCGPLRPVNEAFDIVIQPPSQGGVASGGS